VTNDEGKRSSSFGPVWNVWFALSYSPHQTSLPCELVHGFKATRFSTMFDLRAGCICLAGLHRRWCTTCPHQISPSNHCSFGPPLIVAGSATAPVSGEYPLHAIPILFVWSRTSRDYGCVWYPAPFFLYHHACDEASQARRKPSKFSFLPVQL
jgi:hypothetical protein